MALSTSEILILPHVWTQLYIVQNSDPYTSHASAFLSHWIQILANSSPKSDVKKKKKKKRPCFFAFYGRSGEGNITFFFFWPKWNEMKWRRSHTSWICSSVIPYPNWIGVMMVPGLQTEKKCVQRHDTSRQDKIQSFVPELNLYKSNTVNAVIFAFGSPKTYSRVVKFALSRCSLVILVLHNVNIIQWMIHLHVCTCM